MLSIKRKKRLLSILFFVVFNLGFCLQNSAQNYVDLFSISLRNSPNNAYDSLAERASTNVYALNFRLPLELKNGDYFLMGGNSTRYDVHHEENLIDDYRLYSNSLNFGLVKNWNDSLKATFLIIPKLNSDLKPETDHKLQVGALALFNFKKSEDFKYKLGVYYNGELQGPLFVPIVGLDWKVNDKLQIFGNLPINLTVDAELSKKVHTGFTFRGLISSYYISGLNTQHYLSRVNNEVFAFVDWYFYKGFVLQGKLGYSIGRSYRIYDENDQIDWALSAIRFGDNRTQLNQDFSDGLLAVAKIIYRVKL